MHHRLLNACSSICNALTPRGVTGTASTALLSGPAVEVVRTCTRAEPPCSPCIALMVRRFFVVTDTCTRQRTLLMACAAPKCSTVVVASASWSACRRSQAAVPLGQQQACQLPLGPHRLLQKHLDTSGSGQPVFEPPASSPAIFAPLGLLSA